MRGLCRGRNGQKKREAGLSQKKGGTQPLNARKFFVSGPSLRCAQAGLNLATVSAPVWACSATSQLDKVGGGTFLLVLLMRGRKQVPHVQRIKLE